VYPAQLNGYFAPERFSGRLEKITAHELALNPNVFTGRSDELILSTLIHETVYVWQETHGTSPRRCYHDRQSMAKMKEIGLQPSKTGEPGGKETGQSVTHYILPRGRREVVCCRWSVNPCLPPVILPELHTALQ